MKTRPPNAATAKLIAFIAFVGANSAASTVGAQVADVPEELRPPSTVVLPLLVVRSGSSAEELVIEAPSPATTTATGDPSGEPQRRRSPQCAPGQLQYFDSREHIFRSCELPEERPATADNSRPCLGNRGQYFDPIEHIYRPCSERNASREVPTNHSCAPGETQYFDASASIFRACPSVAPVTTAPARTTRARTASARGPHVRCAPGDLQFFDEQEQIFRPCPATRSTATNSVARGRTEHAVPPNARTTCSPGQLQYFDASVGLFRPCPEGRSQ